MKIFYKTSATAIGGRDGHTKLDDGSLGFDLVSFQNTADKQGVNPEQLFAMGYAACFDSALNLVAKQMKLTPTSAKTKVAVGIGQRTDGGYALDVDITVVIEGLNSDDANALLQKAHEVCPYSNAVRNNIDVRLHLKTL